MRWKADRVTNGLRTNIWPCDIQPCLYMQRDACFLNCTKSLTLQPHELGRLTIWILCTHAHARVHALERHVQESLGI